MSTQARVFYEEMRSLKRMLYAFNMPPEAKRVWKNQYMTGYEFPDGSIYAVGPERSQGLLDAGFRWSHREGETRSFGFRYYSVGSF